MKYEGNSQVIGVSKPSSIKIANFQLRLTVLVAGITGPEEMNRHREYKT